MCSGFQSAQSHWSLTCLPIAICFPLGIATGAAHCDRNTERSELLCNIRPGTQTWLWGYRRIGKTSLVSQVLQDIEMAGHNVIATNLDLLVVHDVQGLEALLRAAVERLGAQLGSGDRRAMENSPRPSAG